jgi:hypothetical protein
MAAMGQTFVTADHLPAGQPERIGDNLHRHSSKKQKRPLTFRQAAASWINL